MSDVQEQNEFIVQFADKSVWNDIKEDLKTKLRENEIQFQYSEKTPIFHIFYKSDMIDIRIAWEEETLLLKLQTKQNISSEQLAACREIYDLLILFSGELIDGNSPYDW